MNTRYAFLV